VIEFGDSYEVPVSAATTGTASDETGKKKGRTVTVTAEDMQKRKNDVKARTTLLLSLPDEHQLRFKMDIKWNMALLSMRADKFWKKTGSAELPEARTEEGATTTNKCLKLKNRLQKQFALMAKTSDESKELEILKKEKEGLDGKLAGFQIASKDIDILLESQRLDKNKEGLGYSAVPPPPA
nr:hypothetical protein [Tanacetum cinerariifolium]